MMVSDVDYYAAFLASRILLFLAFLFAAWCFGYYYMDYHGRHRGI